MRRLALIVSLLCALLAGVLAGRAPHDAVAPAAPLARLDAARTSGRAALAAATTPQSQRAAALRLAAAYLTARRDSVGPLRPALDTAAGAYTNLAGATGDHSLFTAATGRVNRAEAALTVTRRARPHGPPHWPAVPFALIAMALAIYVTRRRPTHIACDPRPLFRYTPSPDFVAWDAHAPDELA